MKKRPFGKTGLYVSILGFGAGGIGTDSFSDREAAFLLNSVVDAGMNLIDTARSYGLAEERIGRHLTRRRQEIILSTKIGYGIDGFQDWTPSIIEAGIDRALRVLKTDCIDIVHFHSCPLNILIQEEMIQSLQRAKEAGKIRVAAYSGDNEPFEWALNSGKFDALQVSINICDQYAIPFLMRAEERGVGIIAKRALANAPWRDEPPAPGDTAAAEYRERWKAMQFDFAPPEAAEKALRFVAYFPGLHCCLIGSTNANHILQNIKMLEAGPLDEEDSALIRSRFLEKGSNWPGQI